MEWIGYVWFVIWIFGFTIFTIRTIISSLKPKWIINVVYSHGGILKTPGYFLEVVNNDVFFTNINTRHKNKISRARQKTIDNIWNEVKNYKIN